MRRSSGTPALRSMRPFCTSIAQRTASTTLRNSMMTAVAGALDDAAMMGGDGGVDQVAAQAPEGARACDPRRRRRAGCSRRRRRPGSPRVSGSRSWRAPLGAATLAQMPAPVCLFWTRRTADARIPSVPGTKRPGSLLVDLTGSPDPRRTSAMGAKETPTSHLVYFSCPTDAEVSRTKKSQSPSANRTHSGRPRLGLGNRAPLSLPLALILGPAQGLTPSTREGSATRACGLFGFACAVIAALGRTHRAPVARGWSPPPRQEPERCLKPFRSLTPVAGT